MAFEIILKGSNNIFEFVGANVLGTTDNELNVFFFSFFDKSTDFGFIFGIKAGVDTEMFESMFNFDEDGFVFFGRNEVKSAFVTEFGGIVQFAVRVSARAAEATHNFGRLSTLETTSHINEGDFGFGRFLYNF